MIAIVTIMSMVAVAVPMLVVVASNGDGCVRLIHFYLGHILLLDKWPQIS